MTQQRISDERDILVRLIAAHQRCERDCTSYGSGCGCAQAAADAILEAGFHRVSHQLDGDPLVIGSRITPRISEGFLAELRERAARHFVDMSGAAILTKEALEATDRLQTLAIDIAADLSDARALLVQKDAEIEDLRNVGVPCELFCPRCKLQHIDQPQPEKGWTNPPHRTHECQGCGCLWRPFGVATFGVAHTKAIEKDAEIAALKADNELQQSILDRWSGYVTGRAIIRTDGS